MVRGKSKGPGFHFAARRGQTFFCVGPPIAADLRPLFVKDESRTIQDLLTELIAVTGENIVIRRFTRYQLGDVA